MAAVNIWRENDTAIRPKGSCAGCHGADFFDLARIGTPGETTIRRAVTDGATQQEAETLVKAIQLLRKDYQLPEENHQTFRPFQPGGEVLPGANFRERDVAFGRQLETFLPTLMGERIDSLGDAKKARDELLALNVRDIKVGIEFPLWSADIFNGDDFGTTNDWISDLAFEPKAGSETVWYALQDAYLKDPSDLNFWTMYGQVDELLEVFPKNLPWRAKEMSKHKFKSALLGQHMLRSEAVGSDTFLQGKIAFSYLDQPELRKLLESDQDFYDDHILPAADPWDIGDFNGRSVFQSSLNAGWDKSMRLALAEVGFPEFVQKSVSDNRHRWQEGDDLRLAWFWIGFIFDPSFHRLGKSGSTKGGEYINQSLVGKGLYIHDMFTIAMRKVYRTLPEAKTEYDYGTYKKVTPLFSMAYYFFQYHPSDGKPKDATPEQLELWSRFSANFSRMSIYLYLESLEQGGAKFYYEVIETY
jgi:hypothetical protein